MLCNVFLFISFFDFDKIQIQNPHTHMTHTHTTWLYSLMYNYTVINNEKKTSTIIIIMMKNIWWLKPKPKPKKKLTLAVCVFFGFAVISMKNFHLNKSVFLNNNNEFDDWLDGTVWRLSPPVGIELFSCFHHHVSMMFGFCFGKCWNLCVCVCRIWSDALMQKSFLHFSDSFFLFQILNSNLERLFFFFKIRICCCYRFPFFSFLLCNFIIPG